MRMMEPPSDVEHGKNPYVSAHAAIGGGGGVDACGMPPKGQDMAGMPTASRRIGAI